jgi:AcrR family transcriptional regulator
MSPPKRPPEDVAALRASLVEHALRLIARDGPEALTMRSLAAEAGCAVGLPYKVFADRADLVAEICHAEFNRLTRVYEDLEGKAGTATVGANLVWFAELLLDSPAVALTREALADHGLAETVTRRAHDTGTGPGGFEGAIARYLAAEKAVGRVAGDVDDDAIAFFVAGATHNLVVSGDAWPRPSRRTLKRHLDAIAAVIAPPDGG